VTPPHPAGRRPDRWRAPQAVRPGANRVIMRAVAVREHGTAPVVSEVAGPAWPAAEVLAASLNPVDVAVAAGLN
jgi:hypothetical protein